MQTTSPTHSLSNAVREEMIRQNATDAALLLDALYSCHCTTGQYYSVAEIAAITQHLGISAKVIRSALHCPIYRRVYEPTKGRKKAVYLLPTPRQVQMWFLVLDLSERGDILPYSAYQSVHDYKKHLHIAMIARLAHQSGGRFRMTRKAMAARLNVTTASIRNYEKDTAVIVHHIVSIVSLKTLFGSNLPSNHDGSHSRWLRIVFPDGRTRNYPAVRSIAAKAISEGCDVYLIRQLSNEYSYDFSECSLWGRDTLPSKHG